MTAKSIATLGHRIDPKRRTGRRHVLLVDDDSLQLRLNRARLIAAGFAVSIAGGTTEALDVALAKRPDAILSDVVMRELDGFALCSLFRHHPELGTIPIILLSAHVDESYFELSVATGARTLIERSQDFQAELDALHRVFDELKASTQVDAQPPERPVSPMASQMARLLANSQDVQGRNSSVPHNVDEADVDVTNDVAVAREDAAASEDKYRTLLENIPAVVWSATREGEFTFIGTNVVKLCGFPADEIMASSSCWTNRIHHDDVASVRDAFRSVAPRGFCIDYRLQHKQGHWIWVRAHATSRVTAGRQQLIDGTFADVTEQKRVEEQLRQAQKMEAVGRLTGGIAHDFNNILAVIMGYGELLRPVVPEHDGRRRSLDSMLEAAGRAAGLTGQLLAFSRRQLLEPRVLDIGKIVSGVETMLRRLIGEDVDLFVSSVKNLSLVRADAGQLEQVIVNLVVNARDAMPRGGKLSIETANVTINHERHPTLPPGDYVTLTVRDSGCGMTDDTRRRLFEPFFTTKETGKGTGLGLSTCYAIVKQTNGAIDVQSELGLGSAFTVYLPATSVPPSEARERATPSTETLMGTESILLIEDNGPLRLLIRRMLGDRGYQILEASDGQEALAVSAAHNHQIDLVLSDVVVPGLNGPAIVDKIRAAGGRPRTLFMSGYSDHPILQDRSLQASVNFIQKPFAPNAIARKIREILDAGVTGSAGLDDILIGSSVS